MQCRECGGLVVRDGFEYVCTECGLVNEEEIVPIVIKVSEYNRQAYLKPGTKLCDIHIGKINRRLKMMVTKEVDTKILKYLQRVKIADTKELWRQFKDDFKDKDEFYRTLRRLKEQKRIRQGYIALNKR